MADIHPPVGLPARFIPVYQLLDADIDMMPRVEQVVLAQPFFGAVVPVPGGSASLPRSLPGEMGARMRCSTGCLPRESTVGVGYGLGIARSVPSLVPGGVECDSVLTAPVGLVGDEGMSSDGLVAPGFSGAGVASDVLPVPVGPVGRGGALSDGLWAPRFSGAGSVALPTAVLANSVSPVPVGPVSRASVSRALMRGRGGVFGGWSDPSIVGPMVPPAARSVPVGPFGFLFSPQMSVQSTGGGTPRGSLSSSSSSSSACVGGPAVVPVSGVPLPRVLSVAALLATRQPIPLGALFSEFGGASFDFLIQRGVSLYGMGNVGPQVFDPLDEIAPACASSYVRVLLFAPHGLVGNHCV
jgi:hypothetical protein